MSKAGKQSRKELEIFPGKTEESRRRQKRKYTNILTREKQGRRTRIRTNNRKKNKGKDQDKTKKKGSQPKLADSGSVTTQSGCHQPF